MHRKRVSPDASDPDNGARLWKASEPLVAKSRESHGGSVPAERTSPGLTQAQVSPGFRAVSLCYRLFGFERGVGPWWGRGRAGHPRSRDRRGRRRGPRGSRVAYIAYVMYVAVGDQETNDGIPFVHRHA